MDDPSKGADTDADRVASGHDRRRARSARQVLDAARQILAESGFGALTIEGVAVRSGVAKTTIYRRYRSKNDLALGVLLDMVGEVSTQDASGDTREALVSLVDRTARFMSTTAIGRVMQGLVAEVASDPELAETYRSRVVSRRVADVTALVERGVERGELRPDLDPELVTDLLLGPIYYRFFLSGAPLDHDFAERLVDTLMPVLSSPRPSAP